MWSWILSIGTKVAGGFSGIYGYLIVAAVCLSIGTGTGWKIEGWRWGAAETKSVVAADKALDKEAKQQNAAAAAFEQKQESQNVTTQTRIQYVDRVVERPIYRNVCLDVDGLRLANAALTNKAAAAPGPDPGVPVAQPAR